MKHKIFVPIKDRERWNVAAMLVKNYPGQASMVGGAMIETELSDLAGLFAQWDGSAVILSTQIIPTDIVAEELADLEQGGNGAGKKARKAPRATGTCPKCGLEGVLGKISGICKTCAMREAKAAIAQAGKGSTYPAPKVNEKKICVECGNLKWVDEQGLCKWCAKRLAKVRDMEAAEISSTGDAADDAGEEKAPACKRCGKTGVPLGKKSGMCASCNIAAAADGSEKKLQAAERRAGGGMQLLARGMSRGRGQAIKGRKVG